MGRHAQRQSGGCRICVDRIRNAIDRFCTEELDEEYRELCHRILDRLIAANLGISRSKPESWAAGIIHAAGVVNLLNDPATSPFLTHREVARSFSVSAATMRVKSRHIRDQLGMNELMPPWTVPSLQQDDDPVSWYVRYGGRKAQAPRLQSNTETQPKNPAVPLQPAPAADARRADVERAAGIITTYRRRWQHERAARARRNEPFADWSGPPVIGRIGGEPSDPARTVDPSGPRS